MTLRINGEVIPEQAIDFELRRLVKFYSQHMPPEKVQEQMDALRKKARDQAIGAKLMLAEAERLDLRLSPEEVDKQVQVTVEQCGGEEEFEAMLKKSGLTMAQLRDSIEKGRKVDLLVARITSEVDEPTEDEMKAHFMAHEAEYTREEMVQAQHILVQPASSNEGDRATAQSRLLEIRERLMEGAEFSEEAAAHSECPSGRRTGGSLGWLSKGSMVPEIDAVLFGLKDGEVSGLVETSLGLHLFKRVAHDEGGSAKYSEVAETIRDFLRHARRGEAISAYVNELKDRAVIEED